MRKIPWQEVRDPRNQSLDPSGVPVRSWKQSAWATDDGPTFSREATKRCANLKHQETSAMRRIFSSTCSWKQSAKGRCSSPWQAEDRLPQHADLRFRVLGESRQEPQEQGESCRRCTPSGDPSTRNQHIDLVNVYVGINEGSDSYGISLYWDFGSLQEHELRGASECVRHHSEFGTQAMRDSESENDLLCISFMDDLRWLMMRRSSGQRQKYDIIQILSYACGKWRILQI